MSKFTLPHLISRLNIRIGTKLAITVGIGVVLVGGMVANQQLGNSAVAEQAELERADQFVTADILRAGVAFCSACRPIRAKSGWQFPRDADEALDALRESAGRAIGYLQAATTLRASCSSRPRKSTSCTFLTAGRRSS